MIIKVGYAPIEVVWITGEEAEQAAMSGCYSSVHHQIQIDQTIPPAQQGMVLMHEAIHAIFDIYKIKGRLNEEAVCENLDAPLAALLVDNPHLVDTVRNAILYGTPILSVA